MAALPVLPRNFYPYQKERAAGLIDIARKVDALGQDPFARRFLEDQIREAVRTEDKRLRKSHGGDRDPSPPVRCMRLAILHDLAHPYLDDQDHTLVWPGLIPAEIAEKKEPIWFRYVRITDAAGAVVSDVDLDEMKPKQIKAKGWKLTRYKRRMGTMTGPMELYIARLAGLLSHSDFNDPCEMQDDLNKVKAAIEQSRQAEAEPDAPQVAGMNTTKATGTEAAQAPKPADTAAPGQAESRPGRKALLEAARWAPLAETAAALNWNETKLPFPVNMEQLQALADLADCTPTEIAATQERPDQLLMLVRAGLIHRKAAKETSEKAAAPAPVPATPEPEDKEQNGTEAPPAMQKVGRIPQRAKTAYAQYERARKEATGSDGGSPTDRECYDWLKTHNDDEPLPAPETWNRYLRKARRLLGKQKNSLRAGREHGGSIVHPDEVEPPHNDEKQ